MNRKFIHIFIIASCLIYSSDISIYGNSSQSYVTGEDGVVRMNINLIGHVKSPGTYLVYDSIDIMSALSIAGGYLQGANLSNIVIYRENGEKDKINLLKYINSDKHDFKSINLNPHDTIFVYEKTFSKIINNSRLPTILLSLINVMVTLERTD